MNVATLMDELATVLATVPGLRVHDHAAGVVYPPAMLIPLPEITYDLTYGRGIDQHTYDLTLLVGKWPARTSTEAVGAFAAGGGASSVKAILEAHDWAACDDLQVTEVGFAPVTVAGVEYLGAVFTTVAVGPGSS